MGSFVGLLLQFLSRIILARYGTQAEYGSFSLALMVFNVLTVLAGIGLYEGTARYVAYMRGKGQSTAIRRIARDAIVIPVITSIVIGFCLFVLASVIAGDIFHNEQLALPLRVLAFGLPVITLINSISGIYRGFDRVGPQVLFQTVAVSTGFFLLALAISVLHWPFDFIYYAYVISILISFIALIIYSLRNKNNFNAKNDNAESEGNLTKQLLLFSLPIMGAVLLNTLMSSADTLILGYFKTAKDVGLYNASYTLSGLLTIFFAAFQMIFLPVSTGLYSRNLMDDLRHTYVISTKWVVSLTFPIFLVLILFPEAVLDLFFGPNYTDGALALRILALGYMVCSFMSLSSSIVVSTGRIKYSIIIMAIAFLTNGILSILLIPGFGIIGAALASAISSILLVILSSVVVYGVIKAVSITKKLLMPIILSSLMAAIFFLIFKYLVSISYWVLPIIFVFYILLYGVTMLFTRSLTREDITVLADILNTLGLKTKLSDRVIEVLQHRIS